MPPLVSGVVLAGGRATRFGSDKMAAAYEGVPLLRRAIDAVSAVADGVIVVLPPGAEREELPAGVTVTHDLQEGEGPLAGLHTGLLAAIRSDVVLVAGGDMPELQPTSSASCWRRWMRHPSTPPRSPTVTARGRSRSRCAPGPPPTRRTPCCTPAAGGSATCSTRFVRR